METNFKKLNQQASLMSRRRTIGPILLGAGGILSGFGLKKAGGQIRNRGKILLNETPEVPEGLREAVRFPLIEALH